MAAVHGVPSGRFSGVLYTVTGLLASQDSLNEIDSEVFSGAFTKWWIFTALEPPPKMPHDLPMTRVWHFALDIDVWPLNECNTRCCRIH